MSEKLDLINRLMQDARAVTEARMLRESLTDGDIFAISANLRAYMDQHGLSLSMIARSTGKSSAAISEFLNNQYKGDVETLAMNLSSWMEQDLQRRRSPKYEGFVMTTVAKRIFSAIMLASKTNGIAIIHGPAGIGKTLTLQAYRQQNPNTVYLRVRTGTTAARGFISLLCESLKLPSHCLVEKLFSSAIEKLSNTGRMILIDEAHRLRIDSLEAVRDLHDLTNCPIAMIGTDRIVHQIDENLNENRGWLTDQFSSRNCTREDLLSGIKGGRDGGKKLLFTPTEIIQIFDKQRVRLMPDAARWLMTIASTPGMGGLRRVHWVMCMCEIAFPSEKITLAYAKEAYAKITSGGREPVELNGEETEGEDKSAAAG